MSLQPGPLVPAPAQHHTASGEPVDGEPPGNALLLFGVMAPAIAWGLDEFTQYGLVNVACAVGHPWMFRMVTVFFGLLALLAGWLSYRAWRAIHHRRRPDGGVGGRGEFMALSGMASGGLFLLIILAQGVPPFFFPPCRL